MVTGRNVENLKKVAEECRKLSPTKEKVRMSSQSVVKMFQVLLFSLQ